MEKKDTWSKPLADTDTSALANVAGGQDTWNGKRTYMGHLIQTVDLHATTTKGGTMPVVITVDYQRYNPRSAPTTPLQ